MNLKNKILVVLISLFMVSQFLSPKKNQSGLYAVNQFFLDTNTPKEVQILLKEACFDCHSDQTDYPWYNSITPVNYWLNSHVKEGKKHFDVSKWASYSTKKKDHKLDELIEEIEEREMPLASYTWTHKEAQLTDAQVQSLVDWARNVRSGYSLHTNHD